jgi:HAD superfamily hydrolase (TIGR01509 family)
MKEEGPGLFSVKRQEGMNSQKEKPKLKCVIYDCDGVLFDSFEANTKLYNDLCALVGRVPLKEEEMEYVHTHTVFESIHFIFGREDDLEKKALESIKQVDLRNYIVYLRMEPHLFQALEKLKEKGILRVINTNRTTSMKHIMERFNLGPYFDMVVTALDVKNPKPHPESVEKIIAALQLKKEEAVFVGDSDVDKQTAESSGVTFIAYKNKKIANDLLIEDHLDLLSLILNSKDLQK